MSRARRAGREDRRRAQEEGERHQKFMHVLKNTHTHDTHTSAHTHTHAHTHREVECIGATIGTWLRIFFKIFFLSFLLPPLLFSYSFPLSLSVFLSLFLSVSLSKCSNVQINQEKSISKEGGHQWRGTAQSKGLSERAETQNRDHFKLQI